MMKQAILHFPDHPRYHAFRNTVFLTEYKCTQNDLYIYKLTKQLFGTPITIIGITFSFHPDNLGFYGPEEALDRFGSPKNVARYNPILRPIKLSYFHKDSHAI